jgi:uncharacterized protein
MADGFDVKVIPRAKRDEIAGVRDGCLLVRLRAVPDGGRANEALRGLIAQRLGLRPADVELIRGSRSRRKTVRAAGLSPDEALSRLLAER